MKRIFNSELYLGGNKKNYFEGWYFRHSGVFPFAMIAGISKSQDDPHSFIQYIDSNQSYYFRFDASEFSFDKEQMTIKIGKNIFSQKGIHVEADQGGFSLCAELEYEEMKRFKKSAYSPSVMGPFSYLPLFCNHAVISLSHQYKGTLTVSDKLYHLIGNGYIEKDYGSKFPDNYFWMHSANKSTSIMCAVAWPLIFRMKGFLCLVLHEGKQYNFSLYTGAKLKKCDIRPNEISITITKGNNVLSLSAKSARNAQSLTAPAKRGKMNVGIQENLSAALSASLVLNGKTVELFGMDTCAFETVVV